ncbi:3,4-dihydroxy-2-butanone-4-phosphate synthase [Halobacteria archaeon AArc-dxtr1]|nr:3,4-dihydroxy-2-butanone-4-phosphate synthase [Halobacteria archaeon AArc-dxtr1]
MGGHPTSAGPDGRDADVATSGAVDDRPADGSAAVDSAVAAMAAGDPVLVHDAADREGETDLIYHAGAVTPGAVARMRNDAGGLICAALTDSVADAFDLPFLADAVDHPATVGDDLGYDDRPSFSLTVNHRDTYTGVTDDERSLTIRALADAADDPEAFDFAATFRVPGHVQLLRAAPDLLAEREGHTELGLALAEAADLPPAIVVCEMLADDGGARSPASAREYADRYDLPYVEGRGIISHLG